ncbi:MAG: hypothetical protein LBN97_07970 [Oscillospiraceae bacterium]|jgi:hypothetical protein|nr:hypothetical protein [Oscillospiraceae bacterium]
MLSITAKKTFAVLKGTIFLLVLYLLQTGVFTHLRINDVVPLLLPAGAVAIALIRTDQSGGVWGLLAGLLCDMSVGDSPLMCTLFLGAAGLSASYLAQYFLARTFLTFIAVTGLTLILLAAVQMAPLIIFAGVNVRVLLPVAVLQTLYSLALSAAVWPLAQAMVSKRK